MTKDKKTAAERIKERLEQVQTELDKPYPDDLYREDTYIRKQRNASIFKRELREIRTAISGLDVKLVGEKTIYKKVDAADDAYFDYEGEYVKLAYVAKFPKEEWLLFIAPITAL